MLIKDFKTLKAIVKPIKIDNRSSFEPFSGFSIDSRSIRRGEGFIAVYGTLYDGHDFIEQAIAKGAACVVAQKYIATKAKIPLLVVEDSYQALISIVSYIRNKKKPFVYAITGSIGKTTTKEMLHFILKPSFRVLANQKTENNLLGVAKTILGLRDEEVAILELGTNQKGEIKTLSTMLSPDVGVITFIKPVHLQGLGSLGNIFREKLTLRLGNHKMKLVVNRDDSYLKKLKDTKRVHWFGTKSNNDLFARCSKRDSQSCEFLIQNQYQLSLPRYREGFISNILAALLAASLKGLSLDELISRIKKFKQYPAMRMQIEKRKRLLILNDAYNANPYSLKQALNSLKDYPGKKIAVIGDMLELGRRTIYYHRQIAPQLIKNNFDYCLTLGSHSRYLKKSLSTLGYRGAFHFSSHRDLAGFINKKIYSNTSNKQPYLIFLKGSRKMELEKVIPYLR